MQGMKKRINLRENSKEESTGPRGRFNVGDIQAGEKIKVLRDAEESTETRSESIASLGTE